MKDVLINFVKDFGPIEWLFVWLLLFVPPVIAFGIAISEFRKKEIETPQRRRAGRNNADNTRLVGTVSLVVGIILAGLVGLLLWSVGAQMVQMTVTSAGVFVIGILIAAGFCLVVYPVSLVGSQLRAAFEYSRRGNWAERGRKALLIGFGGLLALAAIVVVIYRFGSPMAATIFGIIALGILVLGWFGKFLVPEI